MNTYLFLLTVGPVQGFIRQARKAQDLFAGSKLLSDLCGVALEVFTQPGPHGYPDLQTADIYPRFQGDRHTSYPNRFVGKIIGTPKQVKAFGEHIKGKVDAFWKNKGEEMLDALRLHRPTGFDEQLAQHLEVYWVAVPLADERAYAETYPQLEQLMGSLKNHRPLSQYSYQAPLIPFGERGRKCQLDGERNALFYRPEPRELPNGYTSRDLHQMLSQKRFLSSPAEIALVGLARDRITARLMKPGEGLSAVSMLKRATTDSSFPSTARVSLGAWHQRWAHAPEVFPAYQKLQALIATMDGQGGDDQLYYPENLTVEYFRRNDLDIPSLEYLREAQQALTTQTKQYLKQQRLGTGFSLPSYYAVIQFDGDDMGSWVAGEYLSDPGQLEVFHRYISGLQSAFARRTRTIIQEYGGWQLYAGGDDFLGVINLEGLLPALEALRTAFDEDVAEALLRASADPDTDFSLREPKRFTFSAGVVVAHYKTPLGLVMEQARRTEHAAKTFSHPGRPGQQKDTLGLRVMKRSGEHLQAFAPWGLEDAPLLPALRQLLVARRSLLSGTFVRALGGRFTPLMDQHSRREPIAALAQHPEMIANELLRLLQRSKREGVSLSPQQQKDLMDAFGVIGLSPENFYQLEQWLYTIDFLSRHTYGIQA